MKPLIIHHAGYIAGLLDGGGYIGITTARGSKSARANHGGESHRLCISVRMTDRRPLDLLAQWTGFGSVRTKRPGANENRQPYEWTIWSRQASAVLIAVRDHLVVKREHADIAIRFQAAMRSPGCQGLTDDELNNRRAMAASIRALNYGKDNVRAA